MPMKWYTRRELLERERVDGLPTVVTDWTPFHRVLVVRRIAPIQVKDVLLTNALIPNALPSSRAEVVPSVAELPRNVAVLTTLGVFARIACPITAVLVLGIRRFAIIRAVSIRLEVLAVVVATDDRRTRPAVGGTRVARLIVAIEGTDPIATLGVIVVAIAVSRHPLSPALVRRRRPRAADVLAGIPVTPAVGRAIVILPARRGASTVCLAFDVAPGRL